MTALDRRSLLAGLAAASAPRGARAEGAAVTDGAGRPVLVPHRVSRVFPAGPPAAILLYTLAPDLLLGWPRALRAEERPYLLPEIAARPEVGRLTGDADLTFATLAYLGASLVHEDRVEEGMALRWRDLVGGTDDVDLRRLALSGLQESAVRAATWRRVTAAGPVSVALPGTG